MMMLKIDPPNPTEYAISEQAYNELVSCLSKLFDAHHILRQLAPIVYGDKIDEADKTELVLTYQHFMRDLDNPPV
jgi:hypothetical protein